MGSGLLGILAIVLIILKFAGVILWPWWIVLIPVWLCLALLVIVAAVFALGVWATANW